MGYVSNMSIFIDMCCYTSCATESNKAFKEIEKYKKALKANKRQYNYNSKLCSVSLYYLSKLIINAIT